MTKMSFVALKIIRRYLDRWRGGVYGKSLWTLVSTLKSVLEEFGIHIVMPELDKDYRIRHFFFVYWNGKPGVAFSLIQGGKIPVVFVEVDEGKLFTEIFRRETWMRIVDKFVCVYVNELPTYCISCGRQCLSDSLTKVFDEVCCESCGISYKNSQFWIDLEKCELSYQRKEVTHG